MQQHRGVAPKPASKVDQVVKNDGIKFPEVRVIYDDEVTGRSSWKVLSRSDALKWAKSKSQDLILGTVYMLVSPENNVLISK